MSDEQIRAQEFRDKEPVVEPILDDETEQAIEDNDVYEANMLERVESFNRDFDE